MSGTDGIFTNKQIQNGDRKKAVAVSRNIFQFHRNKRMTHFTKSKNSNSAHYISGGDIMTDKSKKHPSEDAFLTNPVASVTDRTGYVAQVPFTNDEAENYSKMFENVPAEHSKLEKIRRQFFK